MQITNNTVFCVVAYTTTKCVNDPRPYNKKQKKKNTINNNKI